MVTGVRRRSDDGGFTLVELLSVVVIIGVLAAIVLPDLMKNKRRAYDASLERALRDAATAQEAWLAGDNGGYTTRVDDLAREGFRSTAGVEMSVRLVPGGYCIEASRPGGSSRMSLRNAGPSAGLPTPGACE